MELTAFSLIMAGVVLEVCGQVAFKQGAASVVHSSGKQNVLQYWHALAFDPRIQLGIAAYAIGLVLWIAALNYVPLSVAFPLASLSYCGVAIGGHYWLGEKLGRRSIIAIAMITIGAALVCWSPNSAP
jgi:undecaprenyl phosphate-alpha-L-ara4N flippase subunit ArnE